ncbi:spindle and kinetochore-associated protein 1-like [Apis laboriosa]|uniref:spindle and kinetochore-associated protein 1-like n=1 Tax=Apis laboriosa TaxID=183418 RepID=UPI001CC47C5C|nr:spindle and kinetochore-associated protein 1-like [Apis laboriosa]XP_043786163.1 spindle and kinetochore-associated protein 1-like [Apis laboriosa]
MTTSLEDILEKQCEKLQDLKTATIFIKSKNAIKEEFLKMRIVLSQMYNGIEQIRKKLVDMKKQNNQCRELLSFIETLDKRIIHMEKNIPHELIRDYNKIENSLSMKTMCKKEFIQKSPIIIRNKNVEKEKTPMKDCKKILFNELEVCPMISLISEDEFNKVPKYIIGRQSLETVNDFINTINHILKTKYTFLSLGKAHARKQGDLNLYLHYKKQELDLCNDSEYIYFFTGEDYEKQMKSKLNKIKLNLITVLRHCKRLREHRIKNDLRYVILTKK